MNNPTITSGAGAVPGPAEPIHQPFSWVAKVAENDQAAQFAALTLDVCHGVTVCLSLIHATDLAVNSGAGEDEPPLLGILDKEHLLRLASAATRMLGDRAFERVDTLNDQARQASAREGGGA